MSFNEAFGEEAIDFANVHCDVGDSFISTGSRTLNYILTGNTEIGIVKNRIYEFYGNEGCGKTSLGLEAIASCMKKGGSAMLVDAEHALDPVYAKTVIGKRFNEVNFGEPSCGEKALEMIEWGVKNDMDLILVDSVASMTPMKEIEGSIGDSNMGLHARMMGQGLRRITSMLTRQTKTSIIFTNQIRFKIGVMFGNPETRPGGNALKFFASGAIVDLRDPRGQKVVEDKVEIGKIITAKTIKNKLAPPYQKCTIHLAYGKGVDKYRDVCQALKDRDLATITKGTISVFNKRINYNNFVQMMKEDKEFREKILSLLSGENND